MSETYRRVNPGKDLLKLDIDENAGSALVVVPIALMAVMPRKRMMVMMFVEPTLVVMVISQSATCTSGDEENN